EGSPNVAVVTQTIANRFWPGEDPIGKQVRQAAGSPVITVVGLVGDFHFREHRQATPMLIRPYRQDFAQGNLVIRTQGALATLLPAIRKAVQAVDPDAALVEARTMDEVIAPQLAQPRLNALLLSAFAFAAVLLRRSASTASWPRRSRTKLASWACALPSVLHPTGSAP